MEPTLSAGQGLVAVRSSRARVGQLRCVEHPDREGFWLVKRVADLPSPGCMWVSSDNAGVATVDSEQLGLLPVEGSWRVLVRIPLRLM